MNMKTLALCSAAILVVSACASNSTSKTATQQEKSFHYVCNDGTHFDAVFKQDLAVLTMADGQKLELPQQRAASGVLYSSGRHEFHTKGSMGFWTVGRRTPVECKTDSQF